MSGFLPNFLGAVHWWDALRKRKTSFDHIGSYSPVDRAHCGPHKAVPLMTAYGELVKLNRAIFIPLPGSVFVADSAQLCVFLLVTCCTDQADAAEESPESVPFSPCGVRKWTETKDSTVTECFNEATSSGCVKVWHCQIGGVNALEKYRVEYRRLGLI